MSFPLRLRKRTCRDCNKEFDTRSANAVRCPACRRWDGQPVKRTPRSKDK